MKYKWLITMRFSPLRIGLWDPFQMANSWLLNGGWVILATYKSWDDPPSSFRTLVYFSTKRLFQPSDCCLLFQVYHGNLRVPLPNATYPPKK